MCKETIEGSLKVDGISSADWNVDSKMITVSFDDKKVSLDQIQKNIAAAGYDNEAYKGDDKAYKALPECCWYERKTNP
jgi:copper chaperone CopZ